MILAAADYALDTGDPPPELELVFQCRRWKSLPEYGGLLDQPAGLVRKMETAENVYNAFAGWKQNGTQFLLDNPWAQKIVETINRLRAERENPFMSNSGGEHGR